jgi:hypothetical protein
LTGEVTTAEEEAVDSVGGVLADGVVVETTFKSGVGGKGREELSEIGLEGAVGSESFCFGTEIVQILICGS